MPGLNNDTKLLLHGNGADGSFAVLDSGNGGHISVITGKARCLPTEKKFGSTSLFLDGDNDYLTLPAHTDFGLVDDLVSDRTISMFVKLATPGINANGLINHYQDATNSWALVQRTDSIGIRFEARIAPLGTIIDIRTNTAISDTNWHQITIAKVANEVGIYLDEIQIGFGTLSNTAGFYSGGDLFIGSLNRGTYANGHLDEVIIQKSNLYNASPNIGLTDTIVVQTEEHTQDANTGLLLHMNSQDVSGDGGSGLYHSPVFRGTSQIDTTNKKFGTGSYFFDGNSDTLQLSDSPDWDIFSSLTGNTCIDMWLKFDAPDLVKKTVFSQVINTLNYVVCNHNVAPYGFHVQTRFNAGTPFEILSTIRVSDTNWHHFAFIKKDEHIGLYLDGVQIAYQELLAVHLGTLDTVFWLGAYLGNNHFFDGNIDEVRLQNSNYFLANPNVGLTDTIDVPTEQYEVLPPQVEEGVQFNRFLKMHQSITHLAGQVYLNKFTGETFRRIRKDWKG